MQAADNVILNKTFTFAPDIISFTTEIELQKKFAIANQLLKSGTSVGANVREAQAPESKSDFVHKMKIAAKGAQETEYWLLLCKHSDHLPDPGDLLQKIQEICRILSAIITTSKGH